MASWFSCYGTNGQQGVYTTGTPPFPPPPVLGGSIVATALGSTGTSGGGQSYLSNSNSVIGTWSASPYSAGSCIITWYVGS